MYCKHAEYACKLQTNLSMNNKQYHDMEEKMQHRIVKFKYAYYTGIRKKHAHDQQKSTCSKTMTEYAEKCDIVIRRSKNTSFTHI